MSDNTAFVFDMTALKGQIDDLESMSFRPALVRFGSDVSELAKYNCADQFERPTGNLKRSIMYEAKEREVTIGTNVEYAPYVEYGTGLFAAAGNGRKTPWRYQLTDGSWVTTRGMKPMPYLMPAFNRTKGKLKDYLLAEIRKKVKK